MLSDVFESGSSTDLVALVSMLMFDEVVDSVLLKVTRPRLHQRVNLRVGQVGQALPVGRYPS